MSSKFYLDYLGTVFELLPEEDKDRFGELWEGYEQIFAAAYQKYVEADLNISIDDIKPFTIDRWIPYSFTSSNFINRAAQVIGNQDLSKGVDATTRYLLRFSIDGGPELEVDIRGIIPITTTIDEIKTAINLEAGFNFMTTKFENTIPVFTSTTVGITSRITFYPTSIPTRNASEFVIGLLPDDLPLQFPKFPFAFNLGGADVVKVPDLRDKIRSESVTVFLQQGIDYNFSRSTGIIEFAEDPPTDLWAKRSFRDEETPYDNFGFLMDIYQKNTQSYVSVLQGLWFAFWEGATPENVRSALYLLFTLPVSREVTTVTSVTATEIITTSSAGIVRTFEIPTGLVATVAVGDVLKKFQPLVDGISVFDKVNKPGFIKSEIGRANIQRFLTEDATRGIGDTDETKALDLLEEHTYLPQIKVDAFVTPDINLANVKIFLENIEPLNKTFLFQVIVGTFRDEISLKERLSMDIDINVTPNLDSNQTTFTDQTTLDDYETIDNDALNLDSEGILFQEEVAIEVYSFAALIDSFTA